MKRGNDCFGHMIKYYVFFKQLSLVITRAVVNSPAALYPRCSTPSVPGSPRLVTIDQKQRNPPGEILVCKLLWRTKTHFFFNVQSFFINALQFLFSWTTNLTGIKRWQMHPEMDGSLLINGINGWLAQSDVGFSGTNIAPGRTRHAKKHGMAKVAAALYVRRRQVDDILNHLFNPIPIRRSDESPQCRHAWFDVGCPWLTMKYQMNLFNIQKSSLIAEEQSHFHEVFVCIDDFSIWAPRRSRACVRGSWSNCRRNWTGRSIWWRFLLWIFFHGQQAVVVASKNWDLVTTKRIKFSISNTYRTYPHVVFVCPKIKLVSCGGQTYSHISIHNYTYIAHRCSMCACAHLCIVWVWLTLAKIYAWCVFFV